MNAALDATEEEQNIRFQEIATQVVAARAKLTYLERQMINAYVGTTAYRLEQIQYELLRSYWDDEF